MSRIRHEYIEISPALAREWLKKNKVNRTLKDKVVDRYKRDILRGAWTDSINPIAFDEDGNLSNGQHRLNAVIKANISVHMWVAFNVPITGNIDNGINRSVVDNIQIQYGNIGFTKHTLSDLNLIMQSVNGITKLTNAELIIVYDYYKKEIADIMSVPNMAGVSSVMRSAFILAIKHYIISLEIVEKFLSIVNTGYAACEEEYQAIAFRNEYIKQRVAWQRGASRRIMAMKQTLSSLLAFSKRKKSKRLCKIPEYDFSDIKRILD